MIARAAKDDCRSCKGTGKTKLADRFGDDYCPDCNGTGIAGSMKRLLMVIGIFMLVEVGLMLWAIQQFRAASQ